MAWTKKWIAATPKSMYNFSTIKSGKRGSNDLVISNDYSFIGKTF